jgi:hypothetical protein
VTCWFASAAVSSSVRSSMNLLLVLHTPFFKRGRMGSGIRGFLNGFAWKCCLCIGVLSVPRHSAILAFRKTNCQLLLSSECVSCHGLGELGRHGLYAFLLFYLSICVVTQKFYTNRLVEP